MRPTEPGWYWYWASPMSTPEIVRVYGIPDGTLCFGGGLPLSWLCVDGCVFLGPLVPPERPKA